MKDDTCYICGSNSLGEMCSKCKKEIYKTFLKNLAKEYKRDKNYNKYIALKQKLKGKYEL